ncbi:KaiC/GvpD/RAD55 family RecA-like ATPase [Paraburkholderia atlantica]
MATDASSNPRPSDAARPDAARPDAARRNVETGVPGFDEILGGGLVSGGVYLLEGMAGAGKTILSCQIGFHRVRQGEKVLYMTLIAESHDKLLGHLKGLSFFDETAVAQQMLFVSGYHELMQDGLDGFLKLIASSIYDYRPSLMIIDGFRSAREFSETELSLSKFIHELNALVAAMDCTTLLLAPLSGNEPHPEHTLVDGLIELNRYHDGMRRAREIEVHKMRARDHRMGKHFFRIAGSGLLMFPRLEAHCAQQPGPVDLKARLGFGLPHLDNLLGGGFTQGSTTTLIGPSGVGKTLLCLQFLAAGLARNERCVYVGFYEGPQRLIGKAEAVSIPLADAWQGRPSDRALAAGDRTRHRRNRGESARHRQADRRDAHRDRRRRRLSRFGAAHRALRPVPQCTAASVARSGHHDAHH